MQGREELTLDHAIERAAAGGALARHDVVSVFLEVLLLSVDSAMVPEPSRVVLAEDGSLSFTQPPAAATVDPAVSVHAACVLATSLFRAAKLDPPLSLRGALETATERFPTLRHLRDAFELELLISGTPPPTGVERRMAIAALMAKARQLRGTSAGPRRRPREQARVDEEALPGRISPHAAITSPALHLRLPVWTHFRLPAWMRRPLPRWAPVVAAAIGGAFVAMLLQRGAGKQPQPTVTAATPALLEAPRPVEAHPPPMLTADPRVAVRDRSAPTTPAVRERGNAAQIGPAPDASPRPVRPLRRRVAAATEASAAVRTRMQQGDESLRQGRLFEALVAFREALDADPSFAAAARKLGDTYRQHHDTALAVAAYERYLEMDPSAADAEEVRSALEELRGPPSEVE